MTIGLEDKVDTNEDLNDHCHQFHAEGRALSGDLRAPIRQKIETQIPVELNDRRGGHLMRSVSNVSVEGLISIKRAETRVSGSRIKNKWVTLATTILEGLNVFEVISVDRVIAQVSTSHALKNGHVPKVTFLGTKFENLRVSGLPVGITYQYGVCPPPQNNESYLANESFVEKTRDWTKTISEKGVLFGNAQEQYGQRSMKASEVLEVIRTKEHKALQNSGKATRLQEHFPRDENPKITCSIVRSINIDKVREQFPKVETVGHVIVIPDFGAVSLGEVEVGLEMPMPFPYSCGFGNGSQPEPSDYFELTMLNMELGCIGDASLKAAQSKTNGQSYP